MAAQRLITHWQNAFLKDDEGRGAGPAGGALWVYGFWGGTLFFATAAFPGGAALAETKMGALLSFGAAPLALVASRLLRARAP